MCAWGSNSRGQLGVMLPSRPCFMLTDEFNVPLRAVSIAAGDYHSLAIAEDGQLYSWGGGKGAAGRIADVIVPMRPLQGAPGAEVAFVLSIAAGEDHSIAITAHGEVWVWGANDAGQLGIGCDAVGLGPYPPARTGLPQATFTFWRTLGSTALAESVRLLPSTALSIDSSILAALEVKQVDAAGAVGSATIAGAEAPCRAACESIASGACDGFSFQDGATNAGGCLFWSLAGWREGAWSSSALPTVPAAAHNLHLLETSTRGGALLAGAGTSHSLLASGLAHQLQCPAGLDGLVCGGGGMGACIAGRCRCEPGWMGEACLLQACAPTCHSLHGRCVPGDDAAGTLSCVCSTGWGGARCDQPQCARKDNVICAGHGICTPMADDRRLCNCAAGWTGEACELPQCDSEELKGCNNKGFCVCSIGGVETTRCADTHAGNASAVCRCQAAWGGADCSLPCPGNDEGFPCSGNGRCVDRAFVLAEARRENESAAQMDAVNQSLGALGCLCDALNEGLACEVHSTAPTPCHTPPQVSL